MSFKKNQEENENIMVLKGLKTDLNNGQLSLMVGTGFSKNANKEFPSWDELLYDLVKELYQYEIERDFKIHNNAKKLIYMKINKRHKNTFYKKSIKNYIRKKGPLKLVDEYIEYYGYREAITNYIEKQFSKINNAEIDLSLHKKLIKLPWNNIYTTNYDTLLDDAIMLKVKDIQNKIKIKKDEIFQINTEIDVIKNPKSYLFNESESSEIYNTYKNEKTEDQKKLELKKMKLNNEIETFKSLIDKIEQDNFIIISSSEQLSLRNKKLMIKIHGTLRKNLDEFGFDNSKKHHYIISQKDYDSYPKEHEAFTHLMRINILQDKFCLFGFSGSDPNFISWVNWVQDILKRGNTINQNRQDYKIYLFDIEEKISEKKSLFYKNHNIYRIPLKNQEVVSFLSEYISKIYPDKKKQTFSNLFNYLNGDVQNFYFGLWEKIYKNDTFTNPTSVTKILSAYKDLKKINEFSRIPSMNLILNLKNIFLDDFTFFFFKYLKETKNNKEKLQLFGLLSLGLKISFTTITAYFIKEKIEQLIQEFKEIKIDNFTSEMNKDWKSFIFLMISETRNEVDNEQFEKWSKILYESKIELTEEEKHRLKYEKLLLKALQFDFLNLEEDIAEWNLNPNNKNEIHWIIKKINLLSLFKNKESFEKAQELLNSIEKNFDSLPIHEKLYAIEIRSYYKQAKTFFPNKHDQQEIKQIENQGYSTILSTCKKLLDFNHKIDKKPFEKERNNNSGEESVLRKIEPENAFKVSQLLFEAGIPILLRFGNLNISFISKTDWWYCFKSLYKHYPRLTLFYSLQYSLSDKEENFIRRILQEAMQNRVIDFNNLFNKISEAFLFDFEKGPIRNDFLFCLSELFTVVPFNIWKSFLNRIWKKINDNDNLINALYTKRDWGAFYTFFQKLLPLIEEIEIIKSLLRDFLSKITEFPESLIQNYIVYLFQNPVMQENLRFLKNDKEIKSCINRLIEKLDTSMFSSLAVLYTINELLSKKNKDDITHCINNSEQFYISQYAYIPIYFSQSNITIHKKIKEKLLSTVWDTNIRIIHKDIQRTLQIAWPKIHELRKNQKFSQGIIWTDEEINKIYEKLLSSIKIMKEYDKRSKIQNSFLFDDTDLINEMLLFLDDERERVQGKNEYKETLLWLKDKYNELTVKLSIEDGLLSDKKKDISWTLNKLSKALKANLFNNFTKEWQILLNRILLFKEPKLELCLKVAVFWTEKLKNKLNLKNFMEIYLKIIKVYYDRIFNQNSLNENDHLFIEEQILIIVKVLKYWGIQDDFIDKWIEQKNKSPFIKIKKMDI